MARLPASRQAKAASDSRLRPRVVFGWLCIIEQPQFHMMSRVVLLEDYVSFVESRIEDEKDTEENADGAKWQMWWL